MKEVKILAAALRLYFTQAGQQAQVDETSLTRQCEKEYLAQLSRPDRRLRRRGLPGLRRAGSSTWRRCTTTRSSSPGWTPASWGSTKSGASTPSAARPAAAASWRRPAASAPSPAAPSACSTAPAAARTSGKCEVNPDIPCGWELIYERLKTLGQLDRFEKPVDPKDWTTSRDGGPRKIVREDLRI